MEDTRDIATSQRHVQGALSHLFSMGGVRFVLGGEILHGELVFSESGFMPHIAALADEVMVGLGWPACVDEIQADEHGLLGLTVRLKDPMPVLAVSALLTAAETMFLDEPIALLKNLRLIEVRLDTVFDYWRSRQQAGEPIRECPWRNRMPVL